MLVGETDESKTQISGWFWRNQDPGLKPDTHTTLLVWYSTYDDKVPKLISEQEKLKPNFYGLLWIR